MPVQMVKCACGATFTSCDNVEALLHITSYSSHSHHWVYINTGVYEVGVLLDPYKDNPQNYHTYMRKRHGRRGKRLLP